MPALNELQELYAKTFSDIDVKTGTVRDIELCFMQLVEEFGDLTKEINKPKLRHKEIDRAKLEGEFADVLFTLLTLSKMYNVDIEKATENKLKILRERHSL